MALSKVDLANQVENQLPQNLVANNLPFRNIIINGDMSIAQRGTSATGITSTGFNTVDRYRTTLGTLGTWTETQETDAPSGQGFVKSLKLDCTTADASPAAADYLYIRYMIEAQNLQYLKYGTANAETLTLSFWVKSNKTGDGTIAILQPDNSNKLFNPSYTINTADTWEKKTINIPADTSGLINNDNGTGIQIQWWLNSGSDYQGGSHLSSWGTYANSNLNTSNLAVGGSTSDYWQITGVQLEAGTTASDFEFLPHDVNLQRCQRYYQVLAPGGVKYIPIVQYQASFRSLAQTFPTEMRTAPTFTVDTYNGFTSFNGSELTANTIHAYEDISYSVASSLIVRGVRLDAEL
jgi:hypothetical protein